jgi:hypothetical protein
MAHVSTPFSLVTQLAWEFNLMLVDLLRDKRS